MHERIKILGVPFDNVTLDEAIEITEKLIKESNKSCTMFCAPNTEFIMKAQKDEEFFNILKKSKFSTPDSTGVLIGARLQKKKFKQKICGQPFVRKLVELSDKKGYTIYFLGSEPGIAEQARLNLLKIYPNAKIVGTQHGYFNKKQETDIIAEINSLKPNILVVTLGMPRQEKWIYHHRKQLKVDIAIGEGGTFDYEAGKLKRAPEWVQKVGCEWLWRLFLEPSRIIRMSVLPVYLLKLIFTKDKTKGRWDVPIELLQEGKKDKSDKKEKLEDKIKEEKEVKNDNLVKHKNQKRKNKKRQIQKRKNSNKRKKRK